ncbi:MAG: GntG family PLP-dependent aldolase [Bacteroidota bacterium]
MMIELRSDTFTKPTKPMLEAMMSAEVGDDVFGEDPTVNALEDKLAGTLGMEEGLFCPSGTMANQIGVRVNTQPQDDVICDKNSHVYLYEGGGMMANSGVSVSLLDGDRGRITADQVITALKPDDIHAPVSKLVSVENTMNKGGGSYYDFEEFKQIRKVVDEHNLNFHLDGARLFNAVVETGEDAKAYGGVFDTVSICLSKGLGAPIGSVLLGSKDTMKQARRVRKVFGGGMRQAGYLAAAGIYALDNHIEKLKEDHERARAIGKTLETCSFVTDVMPIDTNILIFSVDNVEDIMGKLTAKGILGIPFGPNQIRFVTHLDFTDDMLEETVKVLREM